MDHGLSAISASVGASCLRRRWGRVARAAGLALCAGIVQPVAGCGGSSSSSPQNASGQATGGTANPAAGRGNAASGAGNQTDAGGSAISAGGLGDGGASGSSTEAGASGQSSGTAVGPALGDACSPPGALACAGPNQKLTLVCGGDKTWETNQTCASGEFCQSTPGADLGLCKKPSDDCASRQPGDAFCGSSDSKDAMECDADGLAADLVEHCADRCVDGKCADALSCPDNIVYSCDPKCPGGPTPAAAACFELCPTVPGGLSPKLDLDAAQPGVKYAIMLPAVSASPSPCSCDSAVDSLQGVAFRLISDTTKYWRITYPEPWVLHYQANYVDAASGKDEYKGCGIWPFHDGKDCTVLTGQYIDWSIWFSTAEPVAAPAIAFIEKSEPACL
jgi:hypothetical protein